MTTLREPEAPTEDPDQAPSAAGTDVGTPDPGGPVDRDAATGTGDAADSGALGLTFRVIGTVVAPTTLLTALMFYFGTQHAFWFFQHFGINYTILDLTAADYLLRSADGLFVPLLFVAVAGCAGMWARRALTGWLPAAVRRFGRRHGARLCGLLGVVGLGVALVGVLTPRTFDGYLALPALSLVGGTLLVVGGSRLHRATESAASSVNSVAAEWATAFVMIGIGLFWAVGDYSAAVGTGRGIDMEAALPDWPDAVLYSTEPLNLPSDAATGSICTANEGGFRYRYEGLKLMFASSSQYLLLPGGWSDGGGPAVVLPRTDSIRMEFRVARSGDEQLPC